MYVGGYLTEIVITKHSSEKLGMGIKGGVGGQSGNPYDKDDEGIFISWVNSDGAAGSDGRLKPGMRIVEVNETSLLGATYQEALTALRTACDTVRLLICDGYNISDDGAESNAIMKTSFSSSSIDREDEMTNVFRQEQEVLKETAQWEKEDLEKIEQLREKTDNISAEETSIPDCIDNDVNFNLIHTQPKSFVNNENLDEDQIMFSTPLKNNFEFANNNEADDLPSPIQYGSDDISLAASTPESMVDPIGRAKLPGAKAVLPKMSKVPIPRIDDPEQLTFSEKKRRFELVTKIPMAASDIKQFSFFSPEELERMKEEEEKKLASMTEEELLGYHSIEDYEEVASPDANLNNPDSCPFNNENMIHSNNVSEVVSKIPVLTTQIERRLKEKLNLDESEDSNLTPAQQRALHAAKRAAWRQARLKSLEEDALKAEMFITKAQEMSERQSLGETLEHPEGETNHCTEPT